MTRGNTGSRGLALILVILSMLAVLKVVEMCDDRGEATVLVGLVLAAGLGLYLLVPQLAGWVRQRLAVVVGSLLSLSVLFAVAFLLDHSGEAAIILAVTLGISLGVVLVLYMAWRLLTAWLRRRTTERIVVGQIATVVRQNLPLATGLALAAESESGWARAHLRRIAHLLAQGMPLSEAIRTGYPDCSSLAVSLIMAGEQAGQLPAAADQAERYVAERGMQRDQDISAWPYFLILSTWLVLLVAGIMVAVIPKFKEIFKDFGARLPESTITLIGIVEFFASWGGLFIVPIATVPVLVYLNLRPRRVGALARTSRAADWIRWHLPGWGRIEKARGEAIVLRAVRMGVASGMDLPSAVRLAQIVDINNRLRPMIGQFGDLLERGTNIVQASRMSGLGEVTAMALAGGQRGADLDAGLRYAADYQDAVVSRWWIVVRSMIWPVCTLVMGTAVGMVVFALFQPLVYLLNSVMWGAMKS